ncbi:transcription initiation factor TFIIE subunit alpha [Enteropsectra breve]|nr:transcription initiation factor TFIIE subunit alpha [Enteropsectra breve]
MNVEFLPVVKRLIDATVRAFYEPHHVVIVNMLLEHHLLSDTEFCEKMRMMNKEFNKLIIALKDDHIIKHDIKVETKEDNKQLLRSVYFYNYAEARDAIKYKIFKMTKNIESQMKVTEELFFCRGCNRKYSALEAQANMDGFVFKCRFCDEELTEHVVKKSDSGIDLKELMESLEYIIELLKETDRHTIPILDYFQTIALKKQLGNEKEQPVVVSNEHEIIEAFKENEGESEFIKVDTTENERNQKTDEPADENTCEMVTVGGIPKPFNKITEEDKEQMDEDEYTKYFEIYEMYEKR